MTHRNLCSSIVLTLLLSLVLSGGEGIRLFPIPVSNGASSESSPETISSSAVHHYHYAVRGSGLQSKQGGTARIKAKDQLAAFASATPWASLDIPSIVRSRSDNFGFADLRDRIGFLANSRSRGPPIS